MGTNQGNEQGAPKEGTVRASISFPRDLYETLDRIAKDKKVSLAWVMRDAAEKYVNDQWPLLGKP